MARIIQLVNERDNAIRLILGGKGYVKAMAQGKRLGLNYFQSLEYAETLIHTGILCIDCNGRIDLFSNDNGKTNRLKAPKGRRPTISQDNRIGSREPFF